MPDTLYESPSQPRITPAVQWLIAANVGVYFLPADAARRRQRFQRAWTRPGPSFPSTWWTIATYMFVHGGLWHLAFNMLSLWMFGPADRTGMGSRVHFFISTCGAESAAGSRICCSSGTAELVGASAAIMGVLLAYALRWPDDEVSTLRRDPDEDAMARSTGSPLINLAMGVSSTRGENGIAGLRISVAWRLGGCTCVSRRSEGWITSGAGYHQCRMSRKMHFAQYRARDQETVIAENSAATASTK